MLQPQSKRPGERARAFLTRADVRNALRCLLLALILSFVTEAICRLNPIAAAGYVFTRPLAFLYNTLLIACTLSLALLVKRRRFAYTLISAIWVVLSIVDCCIRLVRITPLNFYDFVIFVSNFSITQSYVTWWQIALIVLAVAALITGMVILFRRAPKLHPARRPALLLLAALCGLTAVITPIYALNNRDYTDPVAGYNRSGFAYSFCRSVVDRGIRRPETYDENVINGILADVGGDAQPAAATEKLPNFVFLQLESFLDPANITSVTCSENPVPAYDYLARSGRFVVDLDCSVIAGPVAGSRSVGDQYYRYGRKAGCRVVHIGSAAAVDRGGPISELEGQSCSRKRPCGEVSRVIGAQIFSCISSIRSACSAVGHGHPAGHPGMKDAVVVPDACLAGPQDDRPVQAGLQCFGADFEHAAVIACCVFPGSQRSSPLIAAFQHCAAAGSVIGRQQKQGWIQVS